jgi:endonuclease YncB( thermonuclease family)
VRAYIYKRDQYERVVATVYVRKAPFFLRKDVGMEMIKRGLAVTYEGNTGEEFGGKKMEERYRAAEAVAKRKGRGLWGLKGVESPMEFKKRMKGLDEKNGVV